MYTPEARGQSFLGQVRDALEPSAHERLLRYVATGALLLTGALGAVNAVAHGVVAVIAEGGSGHYLDQAADPANAEHSGEYIEQARFARDVRNDAVVDFGLNAGIAMVAFAVARRVASEKA